MSITDSWGRTITPTVSGNEIEYHVVGSGAGWVQDFTVTFPASVEQDAAIASIEQASVPSALVPPPALLVPQTVSRYQAMAVMSLTPSATTPGNTLLQDVVAAVSASGNPMIGLAWANSSAFDRNGLFVIELGGVLNISGAELDALFTAAAQIVA